MQVLERRGYLSVVTEQSALALEAFLPGLLLGHRPQDSKSEKLKGIFLDVVSDMATRPSCDFLHWVKDGRIKLYVPNIEDSQKFFRDCHFLQVPLQGKVKNAVVLHAGAWRHLDPINTRPMERIAWRERLQLPSENAVTIATMSIHNGHRFNGHRRR